MDAYETECGHAFALIDGTPGENGMRFCSYCGGELRGSATLVTPNAEVTGGPLAARPVD